MKTGDDKPKEKNAFVFRRRVLPFSFSFFFPERRQPIHGPPRAHGELLSVHRRALRGAFGLSLVSLAGTEQLGERNSGREGGRHRGVCF